MQGSGWRLSAIVQIFWRNSRGDIWFSGKFVI
jgi:hypothetical protein